MKAKVLVLAKENIGSEGAKALGEMLEHVWRPTTTIWASIVGPIILVITASNFFLQLGTATAGKTEITAEDWAAALAAAVQGVQARGKAELQDKTMIDALAPARDAFAAAIGEGASFADALGRSAAAGEAGMEGTTPLVARKGRASYLGERSAGHQDPGATSSFLLLKTVAETWSDA